MRIACYTEYAWTISCDFPQIDFDWGTGAITAFGRDYVSVRWTGKLAVPATEAFTFIARADDAVRVYLNHTLILDTWAGQSGGADVRATVSLVSGTFVDLVVDFREETSAAQLHLWWSSYSTPEEIIPSTALCYALPINGSPWLVNVAPGGLTYPWTYATGPGLVSAVAGEPTYLVIHARDALNNTLAGGPLSGDGLDFLVELLGPEVWILGLAALVRQC